MSNFHTEKRGARLRVKDVILGLTVIGAVISIFQARTQLHKEMISNIKIKDNQDALLRAAEGRRLAEESKARRLEEHVHTLEKEVDNLTNEIETLRRVGQEALEACNQKADEERANSEQNAHELETANQAIAALRLSSDQYKAEVESCENERLHEERKAIQFETELDMIKRMYQTQKDEVEIIENSRDEAIAQRDALRAARNEVIARENRAMIALDTARSALQQFAGIESSIVDTSSQKTIMSTSEQQEQALEKVDENTDKNTDETSDRFTIIKNQNMTPETLEDLSKLAAQEEEEEENHLIEQSNPDSIEPADKGTTESTNSNSLNEKETQVVPAQVEEEIDVEPEPLETRPSAEDESQIQAKSEPESDTEPQDLPSVKEDSVNEEIMSDESESDAEDASKDDDSQPAQDEPEVSDNGETEEEEAVAEDIELEEESRGEVVKESADVFARREPVDPDRPLEEADSKPEASPDKNDDDDDDDNRAAEEEIEKEEAAPVVDDEKGVPKEEEEDYDDDNTALAKGLAAADSRGDDNADAEVDRIRRNVEEN